MSRWAAIAVLISVMVLTGKATIPTPIEKLAISASAAEQYSTVPLGASANASLDDSYFPAPSGNPILLGGVPFNIPSGLNAVVTQTCCNGGPLQIDLNMEATSSATRSSRLAS